MTFSDPAMPVFSSPEDTSPFLGLGDGSTEPTGEGLAYDPALPEAPDLWMPPLWLEFDPGSAESGPVDGPFGGGEEDPAPKTLDDPLTGDPGSEVDFWGDPLPDVWFCVLPGPDGVITSDEQEPGSQEDVPLWRGGDAPLPWWRGSAGEEGGEPVLYALDGVIELDGEPILDPWIQVCSFSLGAPAGLPADQLVDAALSSAKAGAQSPLDLSSLPPPAGVPAPSAERRSGTESAAPVAEEQTADPLDALLDLTESGTTGVQTSGAWRQLILRS